MGDGRWDKLLNMIHTRVDGIAFKIWYNTKWGKTQFIEEHQFTVVFSGWQNKVSGNKQGIIHTAGRKRKKEK
jgi:hypothetical protein